jgi:hypothetical protein
MFFVGTLADRMSLRLLIGGGIAISALGIGLMGYVTEPWHVLVLFGLIYGIGNGGCSTITVGVMVSRAFPGRTGFANGFVTSGMSLGQLLMVALLAAVLVQIGWRSVYFWVAAAHVVLLPFIFFAVPRMPAAGSAAATVVREGMTIREAMRTRRFWMLLGIFAVCGLDDFFVTTHLVAFAQDSGVDQLFAGNLLALMGLADGGVVHPAHRLFRACAGREFEGVDRHLHPGLRAYLSGDCTVDSAVRARSLRHQEPGRDQRPDHHGPSQLRRARRLYRRANLRQQRLVRDRLLHHAGVQRARAGSDLDVPRQTDGGGVIISAGRRFSVCHGLYLAHAFNERSS